MFEGLREFRTQAAQLLREDLRRLNLLLERAFSDIERTKPRVWKMVKTNEAEYTAEHWDAVRAARTQDSIVLLPKSDPDRAGHSVAVIRGPENGTFYDLTVVPQQGEKVNGSTSLTIGAGFGLRVFVDDGEGGWWGTPAI
jgi:hypothetical protein